MSSELGYFELLVKAVTPVRWVVSTAQIYTERGISADFLIGKLRSRSTLTHPSPPSESQDKNCLFMDGIATVLRLIMYFANGFELVELGIEKN